MREDRERLRDILEAVERIERHALPNLKSQLQGVLDADTPEPSTPDAAD